MHLPPYHIVGVKFYAFDIKKPLPHNYPPFKFTKLLGSVCTVEITRSMVLPGLILVISLILYVATTFPAANKEFQLLLLSQLLYGNYIPKLL